MLPDNIPDKENIEIKYRGNTAYLRSPGFDYIWIAVQVYNHNDSCVSHDAKSKLESIWGDLWPRLTLLAAKEKSEFYINKELIFHWDWPVKYSIRTYPAPDSMLDELDVGAHEMWINKCWFVKKKHVPVEYPDKPRKSRKPKFENPDDLLHRVEL